MTDTTIASWPGRSLRVIHAPGSKTRWRLETTPAMRHPYFSFRSWVRTQWPSLLPLVCSLNLAEERKLAAATAKLIYKCGNATRAALWLNEVLTLPPEYRLLYVEAVIPHAGLESPPVELLREVKPATGYRESLGELLDALASGLPAALVRDSVRYAARTGIALDWDAPTALSWFDADRAFDLLIRAEADEDRHLARELWRTMVKRPTAKRVFTAAIWNKLAGVDLKHFLEFCFYELGYQHESAAALEQKIARILAFYLTLDETERARARWLANGAFHRLPMMWPVVARLPADVLPEEVPFYYVLDPYQELPAHARRRFAEAPPQSFDLLVKALRRRNECELVYEGLKALFQAMPARSVDAFCVAPKHLLHLARFVGGLHEKHALALLRELCRHELCTAQIADGGIVALDNLLARHAVLAGRLRRYREWDLHFSGRKLMPLSGVQLAFEELRAQLALLAVWHLENGVKAHLAFDPHTYAMLRGSHHNRRLLRRFLRKPHLDFIDSHPATAAWRARYPQIDVDRWRRGILLERDGVRLSIERDYREVLKMGTYVGSCLGLGGHNQFNAATVLLDVNKQVVFARDAEGKFVARQLLAISAEGRLVCFGVYAATGSREPWQPLFAEYARTLAWSLGVTIQTEGHYEIPNVISRAWYDDGHWDLVAEEDRLAA